LVAATPGRPPVQIENVAKVGCAMLVALGLIAWGVVHTTSEHKDLVIGKYVATTSIPTPPTVTVPAPDLGGGTTIPAPVHRSGGTPLLSANGQHYGRPIPFRSDIADKDGLVFFLVVGSDARPVRTYTRRAPIRCTWWRSIPRRSPAPSSASRATPSSTFPVTGSARSIRRWASADRNC